MRAELLKEIKTAIVYKMVKFLPNDSKVKIKLGRCKNIFVSIILSEYISSK